MFQKLIVGSAIVFSPAFFFSCVSDDINKIDCSTSDLAITKSVTDATVCSPPDGSITVSATGGKPPYTFSKDGVAFVSSTEFDNLSAGTYTLTVKDANGCTKTTTADVLLPGSTLTAEAQNKVPDTECLTGNGSFTISASGGAEPYQYKIGSGAFGASNSFTSLQQGSYQVTVKDDSNCEFSLNVNVARGSSGVSYQNDIKPIIKTNCLKSNCHGSDPSLPNWGDLPTLQAKAALVKTRTGNKSMPKDKANDNPPGLPQNQIDLIACWVDDGALDN